MIDLRTITENQKNQYNKVATHVIQSWEWGEFRKRLGLPVLRYGIYTNNKLTKAFQLTLHKIPFTNQFVGYLPKGPAPDKEMAEALTTIGKAHRCAFIKVEPNILASAQPKVDPSFKPSPKPLFTKYNFILDLTPPEEKLLSDMHPKTRYNIKIAQKKGVVVKEQSDDKGFDIYLKLYFDTTKRQGYFGHNQNYHRKVWETFKKTGNVRLLIGYYNNKPLSCWMLMDFNKILYYPYGGSSVEHKDVMANNLVAWEAIKLGKKLGCKAFDLWGAIHSPNPNPSHPFYGFYRFKKGYGSKLVEYIGTFDIVFNLPLYLLFTFFDKSTRVKYALLKLLG